jgi:hypothetical protein
VEALTTSGEPVRLSGNAERGLLAGEGATGKEDRSGAVDALHRSFAATRRVAQTRFI